MKNTRERLIQEAQRQIYLKGAYSISVRSITNELGINAASISYHFKGKEQLIDYVFCHNLEKLISSIESNGIQVSNKSQTSINHQVINAIYTFHQEYPSALHTISSVANYLKHSGEDRLKRMEDFYESMLNQCLCKEALIMTLGDKDHFLDRLSYISDTFEFVSKKPIDELSRYEDTILRGLVSQIISTGLIVWDKLPQRAVSC